MQTKKSEATKKGEVFPNLKPTFYGIELLNELIISIYYFVILKLLSLYNFHIKKKDKKKRKQSQFNMQVTTHTTTHQCQIL